MVLSAYHRVEHCVCPPDHRCMGSQCAVGHASNAPIYNSTTFGFRRFCGDCTCVASPPPPLMPSKGSVLWIVGTHHKTGSFLNRDVWRAFARLTTPPLRLHEAPYAPLSEQDWRELPRGVDVVIAFHALHIEKQLEQWIGRPYRFVHVYRDPVEVRMCVHVHV